MSKLSLAALFTLILAACSSSSSTDGGTGATDGGASDAGLATCNALLAAFAQLQTNFTPCQSADGGGFQVQGPTAMQCDTGISACTDADLMLINTFTSCVDAVGMCSPSGAQTWIDSFQTCAEPVTGTDAGGGVTDACKAGIGVNSHHRDGGFSPDGGSMNGSPDSGATNPTCSMLLSAFNTVQAEYMPCQMDGGFQASGPSAIQCDNGISSCTSGDISLINQFSSCVTSVGTCAPNMAQNWIASFEACATPVTGTDAGGGLTDPCKLALGVNHNGGDGGSSSDGGM